MTGNRRFLGWIFCLIAVASVAPLSGCSASNDPGAQIAKAEKLQAQGKYRSASIVLKALLQQKPNNAKARYLLGETLLKLGDASGATNQLRRALKLGDDPNTVLPTLSRALLTDGKEKEVLALLDEKTISNSKVKAQLLVARGTALARARKLDEARSAFQAALQVKPKDGDALLGLANLDLSRGKVDSADAYVKRALKADPGNPRVQAAKGIMEAREGKYTDAEATLLHLLKTHRAKMPFAEAFNLYGELVAVQIKDKKYKEALANVETMLKQSPHQPFANYLRAIIAYRQGDYGAASDHLEEVLRQMPNNLRAQSLLGQVKYAQGNLGQADMYLSGVVAKQPNNIVARKLLASTLIQEGQPGQALEQLNAAIKYDRKDAGALALLGATSLRMGESAKGVAYLEKSVAADPSNTELKLQLVKAYLVTRDFDKAITVLKALPETPAGKPYQRETLMTYAYLEKGDKKEAVKVATRLATTRPKDPAAQSLLGKIYLVLGKYGKARASFEDALKIAPNDRAVLLDLASLAIKQRKYDAARQQYEKILKANAKDVQAMIGIAQIDYATGDKKAAVGLLEKARQAAPDAIQPRIILARYYLAHRNVSSALKVTQEAAQLAPHDPAVLELHGTAQFASGDRQGALDSFSKAADGAPNLPVYRFNLARVQVASNDYDDAKSTLNKILKQFPHYLPAVSLLAHLDLKTGDKEKAFSIAKALRKEKAYAWISYSLEGDLYMMENDYKNAAKSYEVALGSQTSRPLVIRLANARLRARMANAEQPMVDWLAKHPADDQMRLMLAIAYQQQGENKQAIEEYEHLAKSSPKDAGVLNNLAWLYGKVGDKRAIPTARKAHTLAPNVGSISDTLGWLLYQKGDVKSALPLLNKAADQAPKSTEILYHLAMAQSTTGDRAGATRTLKALLRMDSQMSNRTDVKQLMKTLNVSEKGESSAN